MLAQVTQALKSTDGLETKRMTLALLNNTTTLAIVKVWYHGVVKRYQNQKVSNMRFQVEQYRSTLMIQVRLVHH